MISPADINKKIVRWWQEVLTAELTGMTVFPRSLSRISKVKAGTRLEEFAKIRREQEALVAVSKDRRGFGYTLEWREINTRSMGRNRFIDGVTIPTLEDYLGLLGYQTEYRTIPGGQRVYAFTELADGARRGMGQKGAAKTSGMDNSQPTQGVEVCRKMGEFIARH